MTKIQRRFRDFWFAGHSTTIQEQCDNSAQMTYENWSVTTATIQSCEWEDAPPQTQSSLFVGYFIVRFSYAADEKQYSGKFYSARGWEKGAVLVDGQARSCPDEPCSSTLGTCYVESASSSFGPDTTNAISHRVALWFSTACIQISTVSDLGGPSFEAHEASNYSVRRTRSSRSTHLPCKDRLHSFQRRHFGPPLLPRQRCRT